MEQPIVVAGQPSRNRFSGHVIVVVLLIAFPLLALLVLQQGRVIDAQRLLIRQLSSDSQQLHAMRVHELQNRGKQAAPPAKAPSADNQLQPGAQPQHGPAPDNRSRKRRESKQTQPAPPQEYPATRQVPVRRAI